MSAKKKHSNAGQYLQYLKGELSGRERHDFERGLEADPFEREAMEGLENLTPDQALEDILSLHGQVKKRLARKRRITFFSVAASVASLLIIGTVFLQIYDFNPAKQGAVKEQEVPVLSNDEDQAVSPEKRDLTQEKESITEKKTGALKFPEAGGEKKGEHFAKGPPAKSDQVAQVPAMQESRDADKELELHADEADLEVFEVTEMAGMESVEEEIIMMEAEPQMDQYAASPAQRARGKEAPEMEGRKKAKSTNLLIPAEYAADTVSDSVKAQSVAQPSIGYEAFEKYIREHIKYPDTEIGSTREVVILNFTVTAGGEIIDIKAVRSPGEAFTEEAIRLIEEGPSWHPATNAHGATEEVVRLRIVFNR